MLSDDEHKDFMLFSKYKKLSVKTEYFEERTAALEGFPITKLIDKITIYPFLKSENAIHKLFFNTYKDALNDMLGFDGESRQGFAADSVVINKNEFRVLIRLTESPKPLDSIIYVEFGANE